MREWFKRHNIGLWALSLLMATVLWAYVTWYFNPQRTEDVENVRVEITGEEYLAERNLCVLEGKDQVFTLDFDGRQADLNRLNKDTVKLTVDVSNIRTKGEMYPACELVIPAEVGGRPEVRKLPSVRLVIDNVVSKDVEVVLKDNYEVAEGFVALAPVFQPHSVRLRGPETLLNKIVNAEVELLQTNIDKSIENENLLYRFVDENGEYIEQSALITVDAESVLVSLPIRVTKEVPLRIKFIDGGGLKENENIVCEIKPASIWLSGLAEDLESVNAIYLSTVDLAELEDPVSEAMVIPVPDNLGNLSGIKDAEVSISFRGVAGKELTTSNITVKNASPPEGYRLVLVTESLSVKIRGPEDIIDLVQPQDIRVEIDLAGKTLIQATRIVPATVHVDGPHRDSVGIMGVYEAVISIVEETEGDSA